MDPDSNNPNPIPTDPPTPDPKSDPATSTDPKIHEELGALRKVKEDYDTYRNQMDPVLQTLYNDPELFNTVLDKHNKRLGVTTDPSPTPDPIPGDNQPPKPSSTELDNRQALLTGTFKDFEKDKGLTVLSNEARSDINNKILGELKEMLDPMGNKTIQQVLNDVSLSKLPRFLDKAYDLATKDEQIKAATERAKAEALGESTGIIGSLPSGSLDTSELSLTTKEREIARKQGITDEQYLENKKLIQQRNAQPQV